MIKKFRETDDLKHIYKDELGKACFSHDCFSLVYSDRKHLPERTISDKILKDRAFKIAKNIKYDGYQKRLASMVYKFFDKKTGSGTTSKKR